MPVAQHRAGEGQELSPEQVEENTQSVHRAWRLHYDHIQHSLENAYYQGWDLHPAQLPTRYAAVYSFFLQSLDAASERLRNFVEKAAKATLVGDVFDDAATGQGLLNLLPARHQLRRVDGRGSDALDQPHARGVEDRLFRQDSQRSARLSIN
jgi:hypothetical protein